MASRSKSPMHAVVVGEIGNRPCALECVLRSLSWEVSREPNLDAASAQARGLHRCPVVVAIVESVERAALLCAEIRRFRSATSLALVIAAPGLAEEEAALMLDAGADDIVCDQPKSPLFSARFAWMGRWLGMEARRASDDAHTLEIGPLMVDVTRRRVTVEDRVIKLTHSEFLVLARLAETPGVPVSDREIVTQVLGEAYRAETSIARVHVHHARRKLGRHGHLLRTIRPRAYCLVHEPFGA